MKADGSDARRRRSNKSFENKLTRRSETFEKEVGVMTEREREGAMETVTRVETKIARVVGGNVMKGKAEIRA